MSKLTKILALPLFLAAPALAGNWGFRIDAMASTSSPNFVVLGDSRPALSSGVPFAAAISNAARGLTPSVPLTVGNYSIGGSRWFANEGYPQDLSMEWQLASALSNSSPQWIYVQVGFNDLANHDECFDNALVIYPCYWPTISGVLQRMMTNIAAANARLIIGEVWPAYTNVLNFYNGVALDAGIANWCRTNQYASRTFYAAGERDLIGTNNPNTGFNDWMQPIYMSLPDQIHPNALGVGVEGTNLVRIISGLFRDPLVIGGVPIRRVNTNAP